MKPITILTGPAAAGKNTVANVYATQFSERCAVIDVDLMRWMVRKPHVSPWEGEEGLLQHRFAVHHACMLARSFVAEDYEVVIVDVLWADLPQLYRGELGGYFMRTVRLMPSWDESLRRLHERSYTISDAEADWLYQSQISLRTFEYNLDNTDLPVEQVARWLASLPR